MRTAAGILLCCLPMLVGCHASAPQAFDVTVSDWSFARTAGKKLETDHYRIYTTVSDSTTLSILPEFVETAYHRYTELLPPTNTDTAPLTTYLFATRNQWVNYTKATAGHHASVYLRIQSGGYTDGDVCAAFYTRRETTLAVIAHEGLHQYMHRHFGEQVPAWINEGLSCYVENYDWLEGHPIFAPYSNRFRINVLRQALVGGNLMPVMQLVDTDAGEAIGGSDKGAQVYYAQVWSLVMFLLDDPGSDYGRGFSRLLGDLASGRMLAAAKAQIAATPDIPMSFGQAVFAHYVTEDVEAFTKRYMDYVKSLTGLEHPKPSRAERWQFWRKR